MTASALKTPSTGETSLRVRADHPALRSREYPPCAASRSGRVALALAGRSSIEALGRSAVSRGFSGSRDHYRGPAQLPCVAVWAGPRDVDPVCVLELCCADAAGT